MAWIGIVRGHRSVEAGGSALLAGGLLVYFAAVVSVRSTSAVAAIFIFCLACGYGLRAHHLATCGYDGIPR